MASCPGIQFRFIVLFFRVDLVCYGRFLLWFRLWCIFFVASSVLLASQYIIYNSSLRFDKFFWLIILVACNIATASAWKMLHFAGRGLNMSFTSSSLNVIPYPLFPFCCFDPSVKISKFSWSSFIVNSVLFSMLILYFLFSNEVGSIISVCRSV